MCTVKMQSLNSAGAAAREQNTDDWTVGLNHDDGYRRPSDTALWYTFFLLQNDLSFCAPAHEKQMCKTNRFYISQKC